MSEKKKEREKRSSDVLFLPKKSNLKEPRGAIIFIMRVALSVDVTSVAQSSQELHLLTAAVPSKTQK